MDMLAGAGVAVLAVTSGVVVLLLVVTRPASQEATAAGPTGTAPAPPTADSPPAELVHGDLWFTGLTLDARTLATPDGALHDVVVVGQDVRTGSSGLVAGALTVDATVPFDLVAGQIGPDVVVGPVPGSPDQAAVHRSFEGFGRVLDVEATGSVAVRAELGGTAVRIEP
jgi:hypothetical protein